MQKKSRALEDIQARFGERDGDIERSLREKEEELEIYKQGMDDTLLELEQLKMVACAKALIPCMMLTFARMAETPIRLSMIKSIKSLLATYKKSMIS